MAVVWHTSPSTPRNRPRIDDLGRVGLLGRGSLCGLVGLDLAYLRWRAGFLADFGLHVSASPTLPAGGPAPWPQPLSSAYRQPSPPRVVFPGSRACRPNRPGPVVPTPCPQRERFLD